jgi:predicted branched-subunit amino acid permease
VFFIPSMYRHPAYAQAVRGMAQQSLGIAAWGLMTGVAMVQSGMSTLEALAMTLIVFAGSSQLAAIPLIASGAPAWVILATSFCVNLRFVVFSLHLRAYLVSLPLWRRLLHGYLTADLSYVQFVQRFARPATSAAELHEQEAFLAGSYGVNWLSWCTASVAGIALAQVIPLSWGLGFAGILCLVGVLCTLITAPLRAAAGAVAGVVAVGAYALPLKLNIVTAIVVTVAVCLLLEKALPPPPTQAAPTNAKP